MRSTHLAAACALATALCACATAHDPEPPASQTDSTPDAGATVADEPDADVIAVADAAPADDAAPGEADAAVEEPAPCEVSAQLLGNPGFDDGPGTWIEDSGGYDTDGNPADFALVRDLPVGNHSGSYGAWLGGYIPPRGITAKDTLVQELAIPDGVAGLELTGRAYIESAEIFSGDDDTLAVELVDDQDQLIETLITLSNHDEYRAWGTLRLEPSADLAGRTVRLRFRGSFDADQQTNFFLDTLALTITACE